MLVKIHCLREHGRPIPKHQFAFKEPVLGMLNVHEERDQLLNKLEDLAQTGLCWFT